MDLAPINTTYFGRLRLMSIGVYYYPETDKTVCRTWDRETYNLIKLKNPRYVCGAWKLTKLFNVGGGPTLEDIRQLVNMSLDAHRLQIIARLNLMGAAKPSGLAVLSYLKPTQYKSFYNFLLTLK